MSFPEHSPPSEAFPTAVRDHAPQRTSEQGTSDKASLTRWVLIAASSIIILVAVLVLAGCSTAESSEGTLEDTAAAGLDNSSTTQGQTTGEEPEPEPVAVDPAAIPNTGMHLVAETSDGTAMDVTYLGANLEMSQELGAASPWSDSVPAEERLNLLGANMNAQNLGGGTVTCRIYWEGELVEEVSSEGEFAIASCTLPMGL